MAACPDVLQQRLGNCRESLRDPWTAEKKAEECGTLPAQWMKGAARKSASQRVCACNRRVLATSLPASPSSACCSAAPLTNCSMNDSSASSRGSSSARRSLRRARPTAWRNHATLAVSTAFFAWMSPQAFAQSTPILASATVSDKVSALNLALVLASDRRRLVDALAGVDVNALLTEIGQIDCPDTVNLTIKTFVDANRPLFDACTDDSSYKLYPFGTALPDADQTSRICASPSCTDLMTGLVLAKLPECEYQRHSLRSMAESFMRVRVDLANDRIAPTATEFGELYTLNRVVNYLTENATVQRSVKTSFKAAEVAASMNLVEINPDVVLSDSLVVYVNTTARHTGTASGSSGSSSSTHASTSAPASTTKPASTTTTTTTTRAPSPTKDSGNSSPGNSTNATTTDAGTHAELPNNLAQAYLYVAIVWLATNLVYLWFLTVKEVE